MSFLDRIFGKKQEEKPGVLQREGIRVNQPSVDKETAIRKAGQLLCELGCVEESYIDAMLEREKIVSTYMGMGIAIPHGTTRAKGTVKRSGIVSSAGDVEPRVNPAGPSAKAKYSQETDSEPVP